MSDELKDKAPVCQWCGAARMRDDCGGNADMFWCESLDGWQSNYCSLRCEINTLTAALHATWDKERFEKDGALVIRVMDHEDFEKVKMAMEL